MKQRRPERPERPEVRIADSDRERAVQRLHEAVAEGRLTLPEFEERVEQVLQARTGSELAGPLADLPGDADPATTAPELLELRAKMSKMERTGRWVVPRRLVLEVKAGSILLNLTEAVIPEPVVEIALDVFAGSVTLVVPEQTSVDVDQLELVAASNTLRRVTTTREPVGRPHLVFTGWQKAGSLRVLGPRRFLWWRW